MKHTLLLILVSLISMQGTAQGDRPFSWEFSYEHRLTPIYLPGVTASISQVLYNQDKQLSGNGFGGVITKRIYKGFGLFYKMHTRYDHLYFNLDTTLRVLKNEQAWLVDHVIGVSHVFGINERGKGFMIRLGYGFMNRGSDYALSKRISIPNYPVIYEVTTHEFHYLASVLEAKWIWQKFGLSVNAHHGTKTRFTIGAPFIQLGFGLSYGVY